MNIPMMTRKTLHDKIVDLAREVEANHPTVACILHGLGGAINAGEERKLMHLVAAFAKEQVAEINQRN